MTREERNNKLKYLITCMKCKVSSKCCDENCPTQYDAGHMGEIIENLEEISKILKQEPCEDAISRKSMLDYQEYLHGKMSNEENYKLWEFIKDLPSVTPVPKLGQETVSRESYDHEFFLRKEFEVKIYKLEKTIEELEQEYCEDAVSRRAVLNTLNNMDSALDEDKTVKAYKELLIACYNDLPSVTPTQKQSQNVAE